MKNRKVTAMLTAALLMFGMTGCAENQIPEVTDAQMQMMAEYVAVTVLKYDTNHRNRLVELPKTDTVYIPEQPSVQIPENPAEPDPVESGSTEQTPTEPPVENLYTMQEVMGIPDGVAVDFLSYRYCSSYPENGSGEDVFVNMSAASGKKLMVLSFNLSNTTGQSLDVDLRRSKAIFQVTLDGNYSRRALTTAMDDDLSTYYTTLPAGGNAQAVLIIEVDENLGGNLSTLVINVKNEEKTYTLQVIG